MKIDPGMHIGLHLVFFGKTGVTRRRKVARGARPVRLPGRGAGVHWVCGVPTALHGPSRSHRRVHTPNGVADATWMKRLGRACALDVAATTLASVSIPTAIVQNCITPKNVNTLEKLQR
jgi:ribosomal protein L28